MDCPFRGRGSDNLLMDCPFRSQGSDNLLMDCLFRGRGSDNIFMDCPFLSQGSDNIFIDCPFRGQGSDNIFMDCLCWIQEATFYLWIVCAGIQKACLTFRMDSWRLNIISHKTRGSVPQVKMLTFGTPPSFVFIFQPLRPLIIYLLQPGLS